ncbi:hypothetical protein [Paenibacillus donghaensis]|uniref:Uncharacterized protein n=1 Tax=Paenibacillus donghaensis TaxID=414771 RepID=A0A2Z2KK39_9BACL|nr:hypothetical protein [Paenibacillus donghaensis]ASA22709.1 hypothetical protein B9T62_19070 [Paenibacillus donghaensis]
MSIEKEMNDMTLLELLNKYQNDKLVFRDYGANEYMKNCDFDDEVALKRHARIYEELRQEILITASFIAEKLLK